MTHTPGPWKIDKLGTMGDFDLTSNNYPLGILYHSQIHDTEANARLIAAAPEMLEALKEWQDMFDCGDFSMDFSNGVTWNGIDEGQVRGGTMLREMREKTRRAIAKAEGDE